ncbi:Transcriptional regulatory protein, C terminal - transcriptional regulator [Lysobacter enzymogenes]|uniref:Transcriptional regulatory protein, C terminal-transcriptional regulator n=1 Tax=Lysobacter enzymogenes TaxID=69 RepID=A0A0S2DNW8_LYSEN|nr:response regulator transcription factor [Lysobacter enzymogenes]ALN60093.1 Transcriptional regulatory protein, C terminal - transcriptional regulator [Lysobacter enzymogenes]QCW28103.1 response regulator transcription factor [Lysobacter enzymogenes]
MRVLLLEDQSDLRDAVAGRLRAHGHAVDEAGDLAEAESFVQSYAYGALVLDRTLPDGDALAALQRWRQRGIATPALFLTARDAVADRVEGFAGGADDYLVKPFSMDELVARIGAIGRRGGAIVPSTIRIADLEVDLGRREARRAGIALPLRPKEFALLQLLAERAGQAVPRQDILAACWGEEQQPASNAEEVLIATLRRKLGDPPLLRTVRGSGYRLDVPDAARA